MTSPPLMPPTAAGKPPGACHLRYNSDAAVAQYCDAHYGPDKFGVPNFPARLARICCCALAERPRQRALDLGCAVGRASFELATCFERVDAVDYSRRFIDIALQLQQRGHFAYTTPVEGEVLCDRQVDLEQLGLFPTAGRVRFSSGNALNLRLQICDYDLILAANLLDRLPAPAEFLASIHRRLRLGGLLALASPYNWKGDYTPPNRWLGGRFHCGAPLCSATEIERLLTRHFVATGPPREIEFVLRETARTFQHGISQFQLWRRER